MGMLLLCVLLLLSFATSHAKVIYVADTTQLFDTVSSETCCGYNTGNNIMEVRQSEERSDELATTSLMTKTADARTSVQDTPPP